MTARPGDWRRDPKRLVTTSVFRCVSRAGKTLNRPPLNRMTKRRTEGQGPHGPEAWSAVQWGPCEGSPPARTHNRPHSRNSRSRVGCEATQPRARAWAGVVARKAHAHEHISRPPQIRSVHSPTQFPHKTSHFVPENHYKSNQRVAPKSIAQNLAPYKHPAIQLCTIFPTKY